MQGEAAALAASSLNVGDALQQQVRLRGDAVAVQAGDDRITYAEFSERVTQCAGELAAAGVGEGDRVGVLCENRVEYLELFFACAQIGAILACQNWRLSAPELAHCLSLVKPSLLLVSQRFEAIGRSVANGVTTLRVGEIPRDAQELNCKPAAGGEAGLYILYTSGTTGFPKAALISHRAVIARTMTHILDRPIDPHSAYVAWSPFFHMGATDASLATLLRGGKVIVMDGFDADALARIVSSEPVGHLNIVPGVVDRFIAAMRKLGAPAKKVGVVGVMADLVPPAAVAELTRMLQAPYCNTFGSTETGPAPASRGLIAVGDIPQKLSKMQSSLCAVRLVDDEGREVPDGQPGELTLRSATLFSGYWGDAQANAEAFRGGWYHMGDVFVRNADGTLDFVDRRKYLIKSGGENIYPAEVERALQGVAGVSEAVVVRQRDAQWGEVPVAVVVRSDSAVAAADILSACRASIASYKLPRRIVFAAAQDLPRNVSGKVERIRLEKYLDGCDASLAQLPEGAFA